jgi:hypothetical protein
LLFWDKDLIGSATTLMSHPQQLRQHRNIRRDPPRLVIWFCLTNVWLFSSVRIALLQPSVDHRTSFAFGEFTRSGNLFFLFWKFIAWRMKDYEPLPSLDAGADRVSNVLVFHGDRRAIATQKRALSTIRA